MINTGFVTGITDNTWAGFLMIWLLESCFSSTKSCLFWVEDTDSGGGILIFIGEGVTSFGVAAVDSFAQEICFPCVEKNSYQIRLIDSRIGLWKRLVVKEIIYSAGELLFAVEKRSYIRYTKLNICP